MTAGAGWRCVRRSRIVAVAGLLAAGAVHASALDVSPILIDVVGIKSSATSLTLRNRATTPASVQLRLFRWRQQDGADVLEPTNDVSASPPFAKLAPGAPYVVRIVRTSTRPVVAEESYRLLIDELPASQGSTDGNIQLAVRYSLPVFFRTPGATRTDLAWTADLSDGRLTLNAINSGERRVRVANLQVLAADGTTASIGNGLAGYALGHAGHTWTVAVAPKFRLSGARVEFVDEQGIRKAALGAPLTPAP